MVYVIQPASRSGHSILILLAGSQQTCMTYTIAVCTVKTADFGQRNCPKHVEFYSKNTFEKLAHPFVFIIRIYHDARSPERQISLSSWRISDIFARAKRTAISPLNAAAQTAVTKWTTAQLYPPSPPPPLPPHRIPGYNSSLAKLRFKSLSIIIGFIYNVQISSKYLDSPCAARNELQLGKRNVIKRTTNYRLNFQSNTTLHSLRLINNFR